MIVFVVMRQLFRFERFVGFAELMNFVIQGFAQSGILKGY